MKTPPVIPFAAWLALAGLLGWLPDFGGNARADVTITELRCESRVNPLGLDTLRPRFSWVLQSPRRGEIQTAYQIFVSSSPARLARVRSRPLRGPIVAPRTTRLVEGSRVGRRRQSFALQRARLV